MKNMYPQTSCFLKSNSNIYCYFRGQLVAKVGLTLVSVEEAIRTARPNSTALSYKMATMPANLGTRSRFENETPINL